MLEITPNEQDMLVSIKDVVNLDEELLQIEKEIFLSRIALEFSVFRLYRIARDELWKEKFDTLNDFFKFITDSYGISIGTIKTRIASYKAMEWAGYTPEEAIKLVADKPYLYAQAINKVVSMETNREPELKINLEDDIDPKQKLREILSDVGEMRVSDAKKFLHENYTMEPIIGSVYDNGELYITYTIFAPSFDGESTIASEGTIIFRTTSEIPPEVNNFLEKIAKRGNY